LCLACLFIKYILFVMWQSWVKGNRWVLMGIRKLCWISGDFKYLERVNSFHELAYCFSYPYSCHVGDWEVCKSHNCSKSVSLRAETSFYSWSWCRPVKSWYYDMLLYITKYCAHWPPGVVFLVSQFEESDWMVCHEKLDPLFSFPRSKYIEIFGPPRTKMFEIYGPSLKIFIPLQKLLLTLFACI